MSQSLPQTSFCSDTFSEPSTNEGKESADESRPGTFSQGGSTSVGTLSSGPSVQTLTPTPWALHLLEVSGAVASTSDPALRPQMTRVVPPVISAKPVVPAAADLQQSTSDALGASQPHAAVSSTGSTQRVQAMLERTEAALKAAIQANPLQKEQFQDPAAAPEICAMVSIPTVGLRKQSSSRSRAASENGAIAKLYASERDRCTSSERVLQASTANANQHGRASSRGRVPLLAFRSQDSIVCFDSQPSQCTPRPRSSRASVSCTSTPRTQATLCLASPIYNGLLTARSTATSDLLTARSTANSDVGASAVPVAICEPQPDGEARALSSSAGQTPLVQCEAQQGESVQRSFNVVRSASAVAIVHCEGQPSALEDNAVGRLSVTVGLDSATLPGSAETLPMSEGHDGGPGFEVSVQCHRSEAKAGMLGKRDTGLQERVKSKKISLRCVDIDDQDCTHRNQPSLDLHKIARPLKAGLPRAELREFGQPAAHLTNETLSVPKTDVVDATPLRGGHCPVASSTPTARPCLPSSRHTIHSPGIESRPSARAHVQCGQVTPRATPRCGIRASSVIERHTSRQSSIEAPPSPTRVLRSSSLTVRRDHDGVTVGFKDSCDRSHAISAPHWRGRTRPKGSRERSTSRTTRALSSQSNASGLRSVGSCTGETRLRSDSLDTWHADDQVIVGFKEDRFRSSSCNRSLSVTRRETPAFGCMAEIQAVEVPEARYRDGLFQSQAPPPVACVVGTLQSMPGNDPSRGRHGIDVCDVRAMPIPPMRGQRRSPGMARDGRDLMSRTLWSGSPWNEVFW